MSARRWGAWRYWSQNVNGPTWRRTSACGLEALAYRSTTSRIRGPEVRWVCNILSAGVLVCSVNCARSRDHAFRAAMAGFCVVVDQRRKGGKR